MGGLMYYVDGFYEELRKNAGEGNWEKAAALAEKWEREGWDVEITNEYGTRVAYKKDTRT